MNQFRHIANRIASMLGVGRVTAMQDAGGTQSVQYQTPLEVASAHRLAEFGFSSGLPAGTDVVLAFLGGDRSSPVVTSTLQMLMPLLMQQKMPLYPLPLFCLIFQMMLPAAGVAGMQTQGLC